MLLSILSTSAGAVGANENTNSLDAPSDMFIDLYSEVFLHSDTYEVYNSAGTCITDAFVSEFYEDFLNSDFTIIWNAVAENGYVLKFGEPECTQDEIQTRASYTSKTAYSEWTYVLEDLDKLLKGKRVEFIYRVVGKYTTDGNIVNGYTYPPTLELNMTYPGSLFPYTTSTDFSVDFNSDHTEIYFDMSLSITFQYNYSEAIWQTIGPYTATAIGTV